MMRLLPYWQEAVLGYQRALCSPEGLPGLVDLAQPLACKMLLTVTVYPHALSGHYASYVAAGFQE